MKMKKLIFSALALTMLLGACDKDDSKDDGSKVNSITLTDTQVTLSKEKTFTVNFNVTPTNAQLTKDDVSVFFSRSSSDLDESFESPTLPQCTIVSLTPSSTAGQYTAVFSLSSATGYTSIAYYLYVDRVRSSNEVEVSMGSVSVLDVKATFPLSQSYKSIRTGNAMPAYVTVVARGGESHYDMSRVAKVEPVLTGEYADYFDVTVNPQNKLQLLFTPVPAKFDALSADKFPLTVSPKVKVTDIWGNHCELGKINLRFYPCSVTNPATAELTFPHDGAPLDDGVGTYKVPDLNPMLAAVGITQELSDLLRAQPIPPFDEENPDTRTITGSTQTMVVDTDGNRVDNIGAYKVDLQNLESNENLHSLVVRNTDLQRGTHYIRTRIIVADLVNDVAVIDAEIRQEVKVQD